MTNQATMETPLDMYVCPWCPQLFKFRATMDRHVALAHQRVISRKTGGYIKGSKRACFDQVFHRS